MVGHIGRTQHVLNDFKNTTLVLLDHLLFNMSYEHVLVMTWWAQMTDFAYLQELRHSEIVLQVDINRLVVDGGLKFG